MSESINLTPTNRRHRPLLASNLSSIDFNATPAAPAAVDSKDDRQPYTDSYSFTLSQRLPWTSLMELAYVGNQSRDLQNTAGAGSNINLVPAGSMLGEANPATANADKFRPLQGYQDLNLATNNLYANYNAFQMTWARQRGQLHDEPELYLPKGAGYRQPFGRSSQPRSVQSEEQLRIQPGDRTHMFNAAYSVELPSPIRNNKIAAGLVNGWQVSGIAQWQSGANLTFNGGRNDNFNMQLNNAIHPRFYQRCEPQGHSDQQPIHTGHQCDSAQSDRDVRSHEEPRTAPIHQRQLLCRAHASRRKWPDTLPVAYGPAFFNADLGFFKNFQIKDDETAVPRPGVQFPEPSAVVVPQRNQQFDT